VKSSQERSRVARHQIPDSEKQQDQHKRDRTFGHHRERQQQISTTLGSVVGLLRCHEEACQRAEEKQREDHVEDRDRGKRECCRDRGEHDRAERADFGIEQHRAHPSCDRK
jgi:hypothetical protein